MAQLLGIDVGTSGCKLVLIDEEGRVLRQATAAYPVSAPQRGWSEQDPSDWWAGVQKCLGELGPEAKFDAIGLTGQMHGAVFLDGDGEVVRPAILWNDQRTVDEVRLIDETLSPARVREITCNPPLTGFQLPKILWLRKHDAQNFARVRKVLLPKDFLRFKLTGRLAAEASDASGTGAFDVRRRRWSEEILDGIGLSRDLLPECGESIQITGKTSSGIPVVGGAGDQAAAAVGTGAVRQGVFSVSLGTSGVVFSSLEAPFVEPSGAVHTFCHANGKWHAMGVMLACGGAVSWCRSVLGGGQSYEEIEKRAAASSVGAGGLTFLPYLSGERSPHNDPFARGAWLGLATTHESADLSRAVYEGVCFGLADSLDALVGLGARCDEVRVTSGGTKSEFWMQMLADVLERPCGVPRCDEGPAFGAALLAGVGIGVWNDVEEACEKTIQVVKRYVPGGSNYRTARARYREMYPRLRGAWEQ